MNVLHEKQWLLKLNYSSMWERVNTWNSEAYFLSWFVPKWSIGDKQRNKTSWNGSERTCHILAMTSRQHAKASFLASFSSWQLLKREALLVSMKWGVVLQVKKLSPEVQSQFWLMFGWSALSSSLEIDFGFIVFLLSDLVLLLLQLKLICFDLIPGGCREQCVIFMPLATFLNLMANLKQD